MQAVVPVTNQQTIDTLLSMRDLVADGDWLTISTGCVNKPALPDLTQQKAAQLAAAFPKAQIYAFTSGLANVDLLSASLKPPFQGIFYDYEPNYANEPEFTFDPRTTAQNLARGTQSARAHGLKFVAYLTGQGLFNPQHTWNYADFRGSADHLVVQTQSALKHGRWGEALDRLDASFGPDRPTVQITVTPGLPNAVDMPTAFQGLDELMRRGYPAVEFWWQPGTGAELRALLEHRRLGAGPPAAQP